MLAEGSGPPVLLLHGSGPGTTAAAWAPLIAALAPRFRVIAPDLLGFGESPRAQGPLRAAWTTQALELMDALGHETFAVVGNSAGGAIALSLACARPRAVTPGRRRGLDGVPDGAAGGARRAVGRPSPRRRVAELITFPPPTAAVVAAPRGRDARCSRGIASCSRRRASAGSTTLSLTRDELARITAPVLLVHGAQDRDRAHARQLPRR